MVNVLIIVLSQEWLNSVIDKDVLAASDRDIAEDRTVLWEDVERELDARIAAGG